MAAGDIDDPLTNIPNVVVVDQSAATAAPGAGYVRVESVNGVLGVRVGSGAWVPLVSLSAGLLDGLTEKETPAAGDWLLLQDEADSSAIKKVDVDNLPGGAGGLGEGYIACLQALIDAITASAGDPIDVKVTSGAWVGMCFVKACPGNDAWQTPSTATHTVATGKTLKILAATAIGLAHTDSTYRGARLRNTTDNTDAVSQTAFARQSGLGLPIIGDSGATLPSVAAEKVVQVQAWSSSTGGSTRVAGGWIIGKEV